jgi:hypothetical protein
MKQAILALAAIIAAAGGARTPPQAKAVRGEGCVRAGIEPRCLVVKDMKTGNVYDLLIQGARPPVGLGIEFTGVMHAGPTACMQGIALDVTNWARKDSLKCTPGQAGKH